MSQSFIQRSSFDSWPIAKPSHRVLAFFVDSIIVLLIVTAAMKLIKQPMYWQNTPYFWLIAMWFYEAFFGIFTGTSPGKRLLSLEIYSPRYDGAPSPVQISLRIVMFWIGLALLGIGLLPILSRRDHRGWHDLIGETLVLGTSRSTPSALAARWIPDVVLLLSLLLFSGIGARIFSLGVKNSQLSTYSYKSCDSTEALVRNTKNVFIGLVLSPAYTNCWQAIETTNQNIRDSKIYQLAAIAKKYHQYLVIPKEGKTTFYQNEIKPLEQVLCTSPSKECNSASYLSSLRNQEDITYSENYFAEYESVLKKLFQTSASPEVVSDLLASQENGWVALLLKELSIGLSPDLLAKMTIHSNNRDWIQAVDCLHRLNTGLTTSNCDNIESAQYAFESATNNNLDPLEDYLANQPRDFIYEELKALKVYFSAKMNHNEEEQKRFLSTYPADAIFAESLYKSK